jgi:hypothetical protein
MLSAGTKKSQNRAKFTEALIGRFDLRQVNSSASLIATARVVTIGDGLH